jgi:hypothetical protein
MWNVLIVNLDKMQGMVTIKKRRQEPPPEVVTANVETGGYPVKLTTYP